ncbi:MAG: hypothetical protein IAI50_13830 [Candidatus Eremiobacteraeota bacterium]|nr:hypothetical protein [Candidatus Eremiobacteraeota bacterium]
MAILAAAIGDPIVEAIANGGSFGSGYHDADRSSVLPAALAGLVLAVGAFVLRCLQEWRNAPRRKRRRRAVEATRDSDLSPMLQFAIVFGLQLLIVLAMQTSEHLLAYGRVGDLHGWLGGPAWFALVTYGAICLALTATLRRFMQSFVTKIVEDLREAQRRLRSTSLADACKSIARSDSPRLFGALDPGVRRTRGRAPPLVFEPT